MAKFNEKNTSGTVNRDGFPAYAMEEKEQLMTAVMTTMFGEPKYYGSTDSDVVRLSASCARKDPLFLCKLACYARSAANLRSVSHVLTCVIAHEAREYTRAAIRGVVVRPDDITEIMACYLQMYGKPFPNALKKGIARAMQEFDEYGFAKYRGRHRSMKFKDVLRITHPVPGDKATEELFRKILDDKLQTPVTWETRLSARGNKAEVWNELIASGSVGYMALLRNLRNIIRSGADVEPVLQILSDPDRVKRSRQLPFRFYSAYRMLERESLLTPEIRTALDQALTASVDGMETIPGRTLIAVDVSGSMRARVSARSGVRCREIAALLGALSGRLCEDSEVCYFDHTGSWSCADEDKGYVVRTYDKEESILKICAQSFFRGGGTDMGLPMKYALEEDPRRSERPFDRVIYFSDNICNDSEYGLRKTVQEKADDYRQRFNRDFWVHGVDLQGYGTQQFSGRNFNLIAGWSEDVLSFIGLAERGLGSLIETIEEYEIK